MRSCAKARFRARVAGLPLGQSRGGWVKAGVRRPPAAIPKSIRLGEDHVAMGEVNPEEQLEIGRGVFKRLGDCTGSEIESAIGLIAQSRIERAWIAEQAAGPDRSELMIARRFFAKATDAERDLIAYWQMVKLVEETHLRYTSGGDA